MTIIRVASRKRFTQIDRQTINDSRLSFKARGILCWLLDKPDDWETNAERIEQQGTEGEKAIRSALEELEAFSYLVRRRWKDGNNRWRSEWTIYENPQSHPAFPGVDIQGWKGGGYIKTEIETETRNSDYFAVNDGKQRNKPPRPYCTKCEGWTDGEGLKELLCSCSG